jgi:hypothetical protein
MVSNPWISFNLQLCHFLYFNGREAELLDYFTEDEVNTWPYRD